MEDIVKVHHPDIENEMLEQALMRFYWLRDQEDIRKLPSTSELIDWIAALRRGGIEPASLQEKLPFLGVLLKRETDFEAPVSPNRSSRSYF